jgi:hypothetical protein
MGTRQRLTDATRALGIDDEFRLVEPHRYRAVLERIIESRTMLSKDAVSAPWWWEALRQPVAYCQPADAIGLLKDLAPADELLWFVVEADEVPAKSEGNFWLYEARVEFIARVLRELPHCEYYVVGRKCDWLLCENHHDMLIASGAPMTEKLSGMVHLNVRLSPDVN